MEIEMKAEKDRPSEVVRWDRFLPSTVLTVLLVEPDDSTRHIICVLLRKCSYRVIAVPDGLMAWETLKEQPHNIDLVLTEVELPTVSGFALLTLVMKHDICKNIPVIMMSLHDSISMVLKCMLKGAADFLIKPVRKNELRNLWQHVWRRKSLLGGSVPPDLSDVHRKDEAISENNTASNNSSDHVASTQKNEGSKKVSDAQGLSQSNYRGTSNLCDADMEKHDDCVKLETESLIHESKTEEGAGNELVVSEKLYRSRSEVAYRDDALRLKVGCDYFKGVPQGEAEGPEINNISNGVDGCNDELIGPTSGAIDLIGTFDNHHKSSAAISTINDDKNKFEFSPQLELSLRDSFCAASNDEHEDEGNTLNHSTASAFSWYNNNKAFLPSASTFSELKDGASKSSERLSNQLSANATPSSQPSGATSITCWEKRTSLVVDQAEVAFPRPLLGFIPIPGVKFETIPAGYSHVFPDVQHYRQSHLTPAWCPKSSCQQDYHPISLSASAHTSPDVHDLEQGYIQTGENNNYSVGHTLCEENRVESLEELRRGTAGSEISDSSLCNDLANNSNGGTCGGVCSRDDRNDSSGKVIENVIAPHNLNEGALFVHDGSNGISSLRSIQREAALTKFRLKRKNRCFEKKVRYQTRKTLAEQRPRVKGQFVPRVKNDTRVATADN